MKIDKGIAVPKTTERNSRVKFLIGMEEGDSFFTPDCKTANCKWYESAKKMWVRHGVKFIGRNENGGVRIWRVKA